MKKIYLDYAATTPLALEVKKAMEPFWSNFFGNPMSIHSFGKEARSEINKARETLANYFNMEKEEIIFTSGATESNNLAIRGTAKGILNYINSHPDNVDLEDKKVSNFTAHVVTTAYEHHCIMDVVKELEKEKTIEATFVKPDGNGIVHINDILNSVKPNTIIVSIMYVNNEIGTINDLEKIGALVKKVLSKREERAKKKGKEALPIYFHSDITQGVNYLDPDMNKLGVSLFSLSGHKIYGPKGVGALGVKNDVLIEKIQLGGSQEFDLRAGTHNVTGIIGIGSAIERVKNNRKEEAKRIASLRDYFLERIKKEVKGILINGSIESRVANNLNISFLGTEGESLVLFLDKAGIACSTGSACSSGSLESSHVLLSTGRSHPEAHSSIRFSLGEKTTKEDIDYTARKIKESVEYLRKVSGYRK